MAQISKAIASDLKVLKRGPDPAWPVLREGGFWLRLRRKLPFFCYPLIVGGWFPNHTYVVGTDPREIDLNSWWGKIWLQFRSPKFPVVWHEDLLCDSFVSPSHLKKMPQLEVDSEIPRLSEEDPLVAEIHAAFKGAVINKDPT
jgi:hypothetical protein